MQSSDGDCGSDTTRNEALSVDRRSYLKLAGVAAASVPLLTGTASAAFKRRGITFERSVNMVTEAGCDPTGQVPCDEQIRAAADDHTLLKFPAGEYKLTEKNTILNKTNLGFLGLGDVRFSVPERFNEKVLVVDDGTGLLFENIDIDLTAYGATPGLHLGVADDLQVHDVEFIGQGIHPASIPRGDPGWESGKGAENGNPNVTNALYPIVRSPGGTGVVENFVARNRGLMGTYNAGKGRIGLWVGAATEGTITFKDCNVEEFGNNGCYTSRTYGVVRYEGGLYRNNDNNQIRIGSPGSSADGATFIVDAERSDSPNPYDALNQRGVRVEMGRQLDLTDVTIRDCDISIRSTSHSGGGVAAERTASEFRVENTRIGVDVDGVRGVLGKVPNGGRYYSPPEKPYAGVLRNVSITGSASGTAAVELRGRPDSVVEGCCIHQEGGGRDGVVFVNANSSAVRNSTIDVPGRTVVSESCWVNTNAISANGSCPMPAYGGSYDLAHTLSIESNGGRYSYEFTVSGGLEKRDKADPNDTVSGSTATGQGGGGGIDSYEFSGEITDITMNGDVTLYLDGEEVSVAEVLPHQLSIEGNDGRYSYLFAVSGDLEKADTADPNDTVSGNTATGQGGRGGIDSYGFSGDITTLNLQGDATVYRDGERINPADYPSNTITIQGVNDTVRYEFSTTGGVGENYGVEQQWADRADGNTGSGVVGRGRDSYAFTGELVSIDVDGRARVRLNGRRINPADYPDNVLTIQGVNDTVRYDFSVTGSVGENYGVEQQWADRAGGTTGSGVVGRGRDSYAFTGKLVRLDVNGQAAVHLNGERIDPADYPDSALTVEGVNDTVRYEFAATGGVGENYGVEQQWADRISGSTGSGVVGPSQDSYTFSGNIEHLVVDSHARIEVDRSARTISVSSTSGYVGYRLAVTGRFSRTNSVVSGNISGGTVSGAVWGGTDTYRYTGEIQELTVDDNVSVTVS